MYGALFIALVAFGLSLIPIPHSHGNVESPLKELSQRLSQQIQNAKVRSVAVVDFRTSDGVSSPAGLYFADLFSAYLAQPGQKTVVTNRERVTRMGNVQGKNAIDLDSPETLVSIGTALNAEALVLGAIDRTEGQLILSATVRRVSDGKLIASEKTIIDRSEFFDGLSSYPQADHLSTEIRSAHEKGVTAPQCLDCPTPQFRSRSDAGSRVLLILVVAPQGRVTAVKIVSGAGPEFYDEALRAFRVFRFRPAHDRIGQPIAVGLPVEVTFVPQ